MADGGWENALSTKLLATHCVFCGRPLRDPVSVQRGYGPECADKFGMDEALPTTLDMAGALVAMKMAPDKLRQRWAEVGGAADDANAAWRSDPETRREMLSIGLEYGAYAVSFGADAVSTVAAKVDSAKQCIAAVQHFAVACGYDRCSERLKTKYIERLHGNLILFKKSKKPGFLGVHVPFSQQWLDWCRGNRQYFEASQKEGQFFFRFFDEKKLGFIANALVGCFGDTLAIDADGNMVPLPSMAIEPEKPAPAMDITAENVKVTNEVREYAVPDKVKLGDLVKTPDGRELQVMYIDPRREFVGVGKKAHGKGYEMFLSFAQVKEISGREIAKELYNEVVRYAEETKQEVPPPPTAQATARSIPVLKDGQSLDPHQVSGVQFIDEHRGRTILADEMGLGKGVVYGTKILTPRGWVAVEALRIGDDVIDPDGGVAQVTGVFPQPKQPVFRVSLSDDTVLRVDAPHLWHVYTPNDRFRGGKGRVMSTKELLEAGVRTQPAASDGRTARKWMLPLMQPARFESTLATKGDRTWAPYALGVLLGDGSFGNMVTFSKPDGEIAERVGRYMEVRRINLSDPTVCPSYTLPGAKATADALGLTGMPSERKFVPQHYRMGAVEDRMELLRGLMDTDGDCTKDGTAIFNTSSPQLRDDVIDLVRGLGGIATVSERPEPKYTHNGEVKTGLPAYRVNVRLPFNPFHLARKAERWTEPNMTRGIESIEPAGEEETICISVSSKRSLYVAENYVVTHNTITGIVSLDVPAVVVCPSNLKVNWNREIMKWKPGVSVAMIEGGSDPGEIAKKADVVVINYDILDKHIEWMKKRGNITVLADEAHYLKNMEPRWDKKDRIFKDESGVKRAAAFYELQRGVPRLLLLTGTPIMNRTRELFPLLHMLDTQAWGSGYNFCIQYCGGHEEFIGRRKIFKCDGRTNSEELFNKVNNKYMLRRTVSVLNLPEKRYEPRTVSMDEASKAKYTRQVQEFLVWVEENGGPEAVMRAMRAEVLVQMNKLRETCAEGKAEAAVDFIKQHWISTARPLVVMATHKSAFKRMQEGVDALNAEYAAQRRAGDAPDMQAPIRYASVVGGMGSEKVTSVVDQFQRGDLDVVFYSISLAVGTTLTRGQDMLFVERAWRPADLAQAEARIFRRGQKNQCCFTYMDAAGTIDDKIAMLLKEKAGTIAAIIHGVNLDDEDAAALVLGEMFSIPEGGARGVRRNPGDIVDEIADSWFSPL